METSQPTSTDISAILTELATLKAAHAAEHAETAALKAEVQQLRAVQTQRRSRLPGRLLRAAFAAGLVALLLGSSASAAIPDATTNVFSGCYRTAGSMNLLYVLDTAQQTTCPIGMSLTAWQGAYRRTIVVSPVGTTPQNGTALLTALNNIADASASKPYLLKIEPGGYYLGGSILYMKPYVDIEGSGEGVTAITSSNYNETISGAKNAEMRWLTVQNFYSKAVYAGGLDSTARFTHVTAIGAEGFYVDGGGALTLQAVTTPTSTAEGIIDIDATVSVRASTIQGSTAFLGGGTLNVATSLVVGAIKSTPTCVDDYDASFAPLNASCQ